MYSVLVDRYCRYIFATRVNFTFSLALPYLTLLLTPTLLFTLLYSTLPPLLLLYYTLRRTFSEVCVFSGHHSYPYTSIYYYVCTVLYCTYAPQLFFFFFFFFSTLDKIIYTLLLLFCLFFCFFFVFSCDLI